MTGQFNTVGIIGKFGDPGVDGTIQALNAFLRERQLRVLLDEGTAEVVSQEGMEVASRPYLGKHCDLVIVVGGDGTFLNAARTLVNYDVPLLGINLGRLGFLADILPDTMSDKLTPILNGHFLEEERFLLHAMISCESELTTENDAFNEVVVHKWNVARMIELETYINGQYVNTQRSDGLIAATPTGSTAYALSGGGPILHPTLNAIVLVPICPHTMSFRPIVVDGDSKIDIVISPNNYSDAQVTCDGQTNLNLVPGDRVSIRKNETPVRLIHPAEHDYFQLLRAKLHWGKNL